MNNLNRLIVDYYFNFFIFKLIYKHNHVRG